MQPRTLSQILSELDTTYNPQIDLIRQQQAGLPAQQQAEEQGLQAKQTQAFDDILGGARRRGLGFSGIPIGEQAKYTATEYLPALARLHQSSKDQATSLEQAILGIQERKNTFGQQLYQSDQDRAEQQRQFNEQQALERQKLAAQAQPSYAGLFNNQGTAQQAPQDPKATAQADVFNLLSKDENRIRQEYMAIKSSAGYGNTYDQMKLQLLEHLHPELKNTNSNEVKLGTAQPTMVSLSPQGYSGLSVGVANPTARIR